mgnify:FL=1
MNWPEAFQKKMKAILGEEYDDFLAGFEKPRHYGLRVNTAKITVEEFKELRKKNAKVWHGHLAGMPLADVLEADLMEVSLCMEDAGITEADGQNSELVAA